MTLTVVVIMVGDVARMVLMHRSMDETQASAFFQFLVTFVVVGDGQTKNILYTPCLLYTSPSPRDATLSRMPSSA